MTLCTSRLTIIALIFFTVTAVPSVWGQHSLVYKPQAASPEQKVSTQEGILVTEIEVRKGDTLFGLSRKFNGRGMYFPQILLFNTIKNPNLIYPGNTLRIPLAQNSTYDSKPVDGRPADSSHKLLPSEEKKTSGTSAARSTLRQTGNSSPVSPATTEISLSDLKTVGTGKNSIANRHKKKTALHAKDNKSHDSSAVTPPSSSLTALQKETAEAESGRKLFESAVKAYRQDDCHKALELLERYLADHSGSPLAADATLYKADCFLKLSAQ